MIRKGKATGSNFELGEGIGAIGVDFPVAWPLHMVANGWAAGDG